MSPWTANSLSYQMDYLLGSYLHFTILQLSQLADNKWHTAVKPVNVIVAYYNPHISKLD